jgi:hypothetical protein
MNYLDLYSSYPDRTIAGVWESQVKEAKDTPGLADALTHRGEELFARFVMCYAELKARPRSARRALQRQLARSSELATNLPGHFRQSGRRLQHKMAWSLAGAALLLALGQGVSSAATITVTTNNPNIAADGQCSLIEAIVDANDDAATYPDCAAGSGADTIVLPANTNLTLSSVFAYIYGQLQSGPVGLPPITSRITIEGNGATIARQVNAPAFGLMAVRQSGNLMLENVTLSGGSSSSSFDPFSFAFAVSFGGLSSRGTLTINDSTISGNTGSGVTNYGNLTIQSSTISGNTDRGVDNSYANLTIQSSTISGNGGEGVANFAGQVTVTNSTISGNSGGLSNTGTVSGYCEFFSQCSPGILTLNNSLIAGNQAGGDVANNGVVNANNYNLFGGGLIGFTPGPTDSVANVSLEQIIGPLQNNGGPTQTHALVAGSPAIDAGNPNGCLDSAGLPLQTDQRGLPRAFDGNHDGTVRCDIGAFELQAQEVNPAISVGDAVVTEGNSGTVNATFQVNLSAPNSQPVTVTFSTANRTANAGVDYQGTSGTLTFDPGETTKTITVVVDSNDTLELDKTFVVNLTSATNAFIADGQAVGTIVNDDGPLPNTLANISSRGGVLTGNNVMIGGFIVDGTAPKRILIRSRGPSMAGAPFFVPGTLANPMVQLFSGPTMIAQNDNWQDAPSCPGFVCEGATEILNTGLDPCTPNPGRTSSPANCALESAILITLPPGPYTAIVNGVAGGTGVGLVEVFEADASTVSELSNISTRGFVQSGDDVMIGGLIIEGSSPATVLIRARGPSMSGAPFSVPGTLANPFLQIFSGQDVIAQNDNWQDAPSCNGFVCGTAAQIAATGLDPCQPNPGQTTSPPSCTLESAILITLPPGAYTAIVNGVGGATGVGLVEAFEMD